MADLTREQILQALESAHNKGRWPDFSLTNLRDANLSGLDLRFADFTGANLREADLSSTTLIEAILIETNLSRANLSKANLYRGDLIEADLSWANLSKANLSEANLSGANFSGANLQEADFTRSIMGWNSLGNVDLSTVKGLNTIQHKGPSSMGIEIIYRSRGNIPKVFLQDIGLPDTFITYAASLAEKANQYYSCFISYSSKDEAFAQRLHADLQQEGVRCWYAPEHLGIGEKIRSAIDQSIRSHDKLLIILSEHSIDSSWVETEVETAFSEEHKRKQTTLFPIRLDNTVMETTQAWAAQIRNTRHIGDFSQCKDHDAYQKAFKRLLRDLKAS